MLYYTLYDYVLWKSVAVALLETASLFTLKSVYLPPGGGVRVGGRPLWGGYYPYIELYTRKEINENGNRKTPLGGIRPQDDARGGQPSLLSVQGNAGHDAPVPRGQSRCLLG